VFEYHRLYVYCKSTVYLTSFSSLSRFLSVAAFLAVGNPSFCNSHGLGFGKAPMPSDGCRSTIYPSINPYRGRRTEYGEFWQPFWCCLGARLSRSIVGPFLSFKISHSHPLLPLCFVSNFAEYSCLIVARYLQCYFAFWLTFYWSSFNLQGYFGHDKMTKWVATKKVVSRAVFDCCFSHLVA
jgi:hypothetical protein